MTTYNEELVKAGVMLAGEGLHPTSKGARVRFEGGKRTVIDGPFTEAKEIVAGYWIWECASRDEAIEWLRRAPFDGGTEIELRPIFEADDFGKEFTPDLREAARPDRATVVIDARAAAVTRAGVRRLSLVATAAHRGSAPIRKPALPRARSPSERGSRRSSRAKSWAAARYTACRRVTRSDTATRSPGVSSEARPAGV